MTSIQETRNRAYLFHQAKRAIKKKERIIEEVYKIKLKDYNNSYQKGYVKGKLRKGKVHCGCMMCKPEKHLNIENHKMKAKKKEMNNEIEYYLKRYI